MGAEAADLELHLLGLLGVHGLNVLVVSERVAAVLLLGGHVPLQGLQHALRLGTHNTGARVRAFQHQEGPSSP